MTCLKNIQSNSGRVKSFFWCKYLYIWQKSPIKAENLPPGIHAEYLPSGINFF